MSKIRIVIADDHAVVRQGTRSLLEREHDLEVVGEAGDGEEAVRLIEDLRPDVAIVDIAMPKLNGIEVTRRIKPNCPSTAVLILSAYDNDEYVFALLEAGAAGYLLKDVDSLLEVFLPDITLGQIDPGFDMVHLIPGFM